MKCVLVDAKTRDDDDDYDNDIWMHLNNLLWPPYHVPIYNNLDCCHKFLFWADCILMEYFQILALKLQLEY